MALEDMKNISGNPVAPIVSPAVASVPKPEAKPVSDIILKLFNRSPRRFLYSRDANDPTKNKYLEPGATIDLPENQAKILLSYPEEVINTATMIDEKKEIQKLRDDLKSKEDREKELVERISKLEESLTLMAKNVESENAAKINQVKQDGKPNNHR